MRMVVKQINPVVEVPMKEFVGSIQKIRILNFTDEPLEINYWTTRHNWKDDAGVNTLEIQIHSFDKTMRKKE